jgi:di/tricarboxylate transporter
MLGLTLAQVVLLLILAGAFVLLLTESIRIDLTAVLIIIALTLTGLLEPEEALSGFSSEPAIVVAAVFVLSEALFRTGLSDRFGLWIGWLAGHSFNRMLSVIMLAVAALSAFTHHVTMTAVMLPVTLKLSREHKIAPSKLLMPMSFAASLGTTITIIGAPAFLIADNVLRLAGRPGLAVFAIAPIGLALSLGGTVFMLLVGRFLLPDRKRSEENGQANFRLDSYYTEVIVLPDSPFVGKTLAELEAAEIQSLRVSGWLQGGRSLRRPFKHKVIREGDILLLRTSPDDIATIQAEPGFALHPLVKYGDAVTTTEGSNKHDVEPFVQAVVAPESELVGRTIAQVNFLERYGTLVVGLWRSKGWLRAELSRIKLRAGDVLVLLNNEEALRQIGDNRSFLMLTPFQGEPLRRRKAPFAGLVMATTVVIAALNVLPVEIVLMAGAATVVLARCLTPRQAYQAIDTRIYVFIAGAIPLGLAMTATGTADLLASWLQRLVGEWPPWSILLLLFFTAAVITQLMSDAATTALLAPVAVALAQILHHPPEPFVVTVAMAAVASFFTPIGHHGNLLVYGPGHYQFSDFLRLGTALTLVVAAIVVLLAPLLWPI